MIDKLIYRFEYGIKLFIKMFLFICDNITLNRSKLEIFIVIKSITIEYYRR
jgi:hypothetical protein